MADLSALTVTIESAALEEAIKLRAQVEDLTARLQTAQAEMARLAPLSEVYALWKKVIEDGHPTRDTIMQFVELAHEAAERAASAPADLRPPTDQRIALLEAQLAAARAQIATLTKDRDAMKLEVALMRQAVDRATETVAELTAQLAEARAEAKAYDDESTRLAQALAEARAQIDALTAGAANWGDWCAFLDANPAPTIGLLAHDWIAAVRAREETE